MLPISLESAGQQAFRGAGDGWRLVERLRAVAGRRLFGLACAWVLVGVVVAAQAQQYAKDHGTEPVSFHIPAQPLANALQTFGEKTGVQVLYESDSAAGRISVPVDGEFTPYAALERLLTGSGLRIRYSGPEAVTLALPAAAGDQPPSHPLAGVDLSLGTLRVRGSAEETDVARLHDFSASVQSDVQGALRRNARTRSGSYRLTLDLWLDPSRAVQRTELLQSTGDRDRDAAVRATLQGLVISRSPPPNTPQPVRVVIAVRSLQ